MKHLSDIVGFIFYKCRLSAKPPLDFEMLSKIPALGSMKLSSDGKYIVYTVCSKDSGCTVHVTSTLDINYQISIS